MKQVLSALLLIPLLTSCAMFKSVTCSLEQGASHQMASYLVKTMVCPVQCQPIIEKDLDSVFAKTNVCSASTAQKSQKLRGIIGDLVCPGVITAAIQVLAAKTPATWVSCGCNPEIAAQGVSALLTPACAAIPW